MLALLLSDKFYCFGVFVFNFFILVLVFVNEFVIFSFFTIFVFVNENHTAYIADRWFVCLYGTLEAGATAPPPSTFALPHSITAAEDRGIVCVADRENGRVQCFDFIGNLQQVIRAPQLGPTLYAVTYDKYSGKPSIFCGLKHKLHLFDLLWIVLRSLWIR